MRHDSGKCEYEISVHEQAILQKLKVHERLEGIEDNQKQAGETRMDAKDTAD